MQRVSIQEVAAKLVPEARYAYYRRCQVFRKNGEQCKAPAEKGAHMCYAHAGQAETERRRVEQRRELLAKPGLGFGDFNSIQRTIAAMAQALIDGRIDCKTAGRLAVELQTWSQLLWMGEKAKKQLTVEARRRGESGGQKDALAASISLAQASESRENSLSRYGDRTYSRGPSTPPQSLHSFGVAQDDNSMRKSFRHAFSNGSKGSKELTNSGSKLTIVYSVYSVLADRAGPRSVTNFLQAA